MTDLPQEYLDGSSIRWSTYQQFLEHAVSYRCSFDNTVV